MFLRDPLCQAGVLDIVEEEVTVQVVEGRTVSWRQGDQSSDVEVKQ